MNITVRDALDTYRQDTTNRQNLAVLSDENSKDKRNIGSPLDISHSIDLRSLKNYNTMSPTELSVR